tara:strand:- start:819 stop:5510 length:4692 start_codon:yes stop_codon:yes gene_type:complete
MAKSINQLYNEYEATDRSISFTEFVNQETIGEDETSAARAKIVNADYFNPIIENQQEASTYDNVQLVDGKMEIVKDVEDATLGQKTLQSLPKEPRRIVADVADMLVGGTAELVYDVGAAVNVTNLKLPDKFKNKVQKSYQASLGKTFGYDLIDVTQDEDGEYKYDLQKPETTLGSLTSTLAAFYGAFKKGKDPIKALTDPKKKGGRPPKEGSKAYFKQLKKQRRIGTAQNIAAAELAGQIVIDPEEGRLAYSLGKLAGENDIAVLNTVFEYLDLEDPAEQTAMENRLGLLTESLIAGGVIVGSFKTFIGTLKGIKAGGSAAINQFKKTAEAGQKNDNAFKLREDLKPDQVLQPAKLPNYIENSRAGPIAQRTADLFKQIKSRGFTSKGVKSEKMFSIMTQAENAKVAIAEESIDTVARIENGLKKAAKEISTNPFSKKSKAAYNKANQQFRDYLEGNVKLKDLPKSLQPIAEQVQKNIEQLSKSMLNNDYVPPDIKKQIEKDLGKYLRQTYEIFENPNWTPSYAVTQDAINYVSKQLRKEKGFTNADGIDDAARLQEAKERVNGLLTNIKGSKDKLFDSGDSVKRHLNQMFGTKTADKVFAHRQNIAPEIKALLGKTTGTGTSVFRTLTTVGNYITDTKMYDELLMSGQGKYIFDDQATGLVQINGKQFHALNGKFTTPEIANIFNSQTNQKSNFMRAYDKMLVIKGFGQASATVLNNITHIRNTIGQTIIMAENGLNPFSAETSQAFKVLANNFKNVENQDEAVRALYIKYQRLGLVNQNVKVSEFKRIINDASLGADKITSMIGKSLTSRGVNVVTQGAKKLYKGTEKLYVAEDDLFRIAAYEKELLVLKEANLSAVQKFSTEQLEQKAAEIIRNTMPTYDLIPEGAKALRRMPFGNFFAFAAERFRNTYHTFVRSHEEIFSGNKVLETRGYNRLASKLGVGLGGSVATVEASKLLYGITEEQDKAYQDLLVPSWSENSAIGYYRDDEGNLLFYDLSFTDPNAPVLDVMRASLNEFMRTDEPTRKIPELVANALGQGMKKFFEPYVSEALFTQATLDTIFGQGKTDSGSRIPGWNEAEPGVWSNKMASFKYVVNTLLPAAYKNLAPETIGGKKGSLGEQLYRDLTNKPKYRRFDGNQKDLNLDLLANTTGFRLYQIDDQALETALNFKVRDFKNKREIYQNDLGDKNIYNSDYDKALKQFIKINNNYYTATTQLYKAVRAAQILNVDVVSPLKNIKATNREKNELISGSPYFTPLRFSARQINDLLTKATPTKTLPYFDIFRTQLFKLEEQYLALPLVELPSAAKKQEHTEEFPKRNQKFTGGLISEDYPVTDVSENPSDRDINNQNVSYGEVAENINPYKKDMERLGFNEGKEAAINNWYAIQQKNKRLDSDRNANQYKQSQLNRLAKALGIEPSNFDSENFNIMARTISTAESDNRQTTQNKYEQRPGAIQDALKNLLANADKNKIDKEWLQSIDPNKPETWDDPQADTMMLGYLLSQKGTDEYVSQILQGNFGTYEKGPLRNLYENHWVRAKFGKEYESINPNSDPEANLKRAMDLNL